MMLGLKPTSTRITYASGVQIIEDKVSSSYLGKSFGFVVDHKPDLELAEIAPRFFIGSQDVATDIALLKSRNVTHIVNLVGSSIDCLFKNEIVYKTYEWLDTTDFDILPYLEELVSFIKIVMGNNGCVFVHCNAGVSRAPSVAVAYLVSEGFTLKESLEAVRLKRSCANPNPGFLVALKAYEQRTRNK
ncbi:hypothetical protein QYM36_017654 [Artemia franciscana]|uniref:Dual specificity protein phosphatase 19 n=2 Tax=Artemia franciscana TaxID=6661 RepID=A0AA88H3R8_ARTSF|nr:hypothetical protein QYM36_017654 [Artemia franciscana]